MLLAFWIAIVLTTIVSVHLCAISRNDGRRLELTPSLVLAISYGLYTSALPISRLILRTPATPADRAFIAPHLLGAIGIMIGLLPMRRRESGAPPFAQLDDLASRLRPLPVILAISAGILWQLYVLLAQVRGQVAGLLSAYAVGDDYNPGGFLGTLVVVTSNIAIATIVVAFPTLRRPGALRRIVIFATFCLAGLFVVRGHRNLLGMLVLPLLALYMIGRPIPARRLVAGVLGGYVFLYAVGVVRNFGLAKIANLSGAVDVRQAFDPLAGEFGTSYSVFTRWRASPIQRDAELGATYTRDVVLNIVPHQIWPDRPPTASIAFSMDYYRTRNLTLGLGYSPVIEAIANFGIWGILPVFAVFAMLVRRIENAAQSGGFAALLAYAYLIPAVVNWNRIDMATNVKMFLVSWCIAVGLYVVLYAPPAAASVTVPELRAAADGV
jgi:hypothetical protein